VTSALVTLAQAAPAGGGSAFTTLIPLVLIFGVFWLMVIRPQQKKAKQHNEMLNQLRPGDVVVTQGGIIGRISGIKDLEVTIEVQQGVRLKVLRTHVTSKHTPGEPVKADAKAS
jgi:preprotein translocase subunit YajC